MSCRRFTLPVISPFRLDLTVWALRRRQKNIVDQWDGSRYIRVIVPDKTPIKLTITQKSNLNLSVSMHCEKGITLEMQKDSEDIIRNMFGLTVNLLPFYTISITNETLKPLIDQFLGVRPPRFPSIFEALINSIACQQVTLDLGILILNRFAEKFGTKFVDIYTISYAFPRPEDLADASVEDIKELGFSYQKARAIKELATKIEANEINITYLEVLTNEDAVKFLTTLRGIGRWSAEYVLLRGLGRLDIFPGDDVGARNNLQRLFHLKEKPNYEEIKEMTSHWHPYEGFIYFHLLLEKLHMKGVI